MYVTKKIGYGVVLVLVCGCATFFGWDIHAPGVLSENFYFDRSPYMIRMALYLPDSVATYVATDRGGRLADPQTYYVGESFVSMLIEGMQASFEEFVLLEIPPSSALLKQYTIPYVVVVDDVTCGNRVTLRGQRLMLHVRVRLYNDDGKLITTFSAEGSSAARRVFAKRGGPEVNLNAALENTIRAVVDGVSDGIAMDSEAEDNPYG